VNPIDLIIKESLRRPFGRRLVSEIVNLYDKRLCSPAMVERQATSGSQLCSGFTFSVGIAHHNRGSLIARPLRNLLNHPAVVEVVIVDDGSSESEFKSLQEQVRLIDKKGRVKIHRREKNLGALLTKLECVERSASDWVLVLDSDNTAFRCYLDQLSSLKTPSDDTIYCANWAFPFFSFQELAGTEINFARACSLTRSGILRRVYIINDGNYLVPRKEYIRCISKIGPLKSDVADVMLVNYRWLSEGNKIAVLSRAAYMHRVEAGSFWKTTEDASRERVMELFSRFSNGSPWDDEYEESLCGQDHTQPDALQK
jgi:glycosyltransferase involved in cell wall biosynthesis